MTESEKRGEAFVVWLDRDEPAGCAGRVEHVSTSRRHAFRTADELIAFLMQSRAAPSGSRPDDTSTSPAP